MTDLKRLTVLVTGAGGGFGKHMVEQLLERQCTLVVTDLDAELLAQLDAEGSNGKIAIKHPADLSVATQCHALADKCEQANVVPDVLINNAGIAVVGRHERIPTARWESLMALNLLAPMRLAGLFLPGMIAKGGGHIVNVSSLAGWIGSPNLSSYVASKFGLRGFGESLAAENDAGNIRLSNIYPSFCRTPILDSDQFGMGKRMRIPERALSEPDVVVANMLRGIERDQLHIFPDKTALRAHYLKRFVPWAIPLLTRKLEKRINEQQ